MVIYDYIYLRRFYNEIEGLKFFILFLEILIFNGYSYKIMFGILYNYFFIIKD